MQDISKVNNSSGGGLYLQQNPRVKETLSRSAAARLSSEKNSDPLSLATDFSVEHPRTCDICTRCETLLNPILVCSSCKVTSTCLLNFQQPSLAPSSLTIDKPLDDFILYFLYFFSFSLQQIAVHLDCYRGVKKSAGPWYCELCEDQLSSRVSGISNTSSWEKPYFVAECGFCGGTAGAFRKSIGGQWVHAFCAEVIFFLLCLKCVCWCFILFSFYFYVYDFFKHQLQWVHIISVSLVGVRILIPKRTSKSD